MVYQSEFSRIFIEIKSLRTIESISFKERCFLLYYYDKHSGIIVIGGKDNEDLDTLPFYGFRNLILLQSSLASFHNNYSVSIHNSIYIYTTLNFRQD
jgi:hypothetical protein